MRATVKWLLRLVIVACLLPNLLLLLPWGQDYLRRQASKHYAVEFRAVSAVFPFYASFSDLEIQDGEQQLHIEELSIWASPGMLLAGWVEAEDFSAEGLMIQSPALDKPLPNLRLSGKAAWSWATGQWRGDLTLYQPDTGSWSRIHADGKPLEPIHCSVEEPADGLITSSLDLKHPVASKLKLDLRPDDQYSRIKAFYRWDAPELQLQSCGELHWERGANLDVRSMHAEGPAFSLAAQGTLSSAFVLESSTITLHVKELPQLPGLACRGGADISINASGPLRQPLLDVQVFSDYIDLGDKQLSNMRCAAKLSTEQAKLDCSALYRGRTLISKLELKRDLKEDTDTLELHELTASYDGYELKTSGALDLGTLAYWFDGSLAGDSTPGWQLEIAGHGSAGQEPLLEINKLDGRLESLPLSGDRNPSLSWTDNGLAISPFRIRVGNGALSGQLRCDDEQSELVVDLAALPADLIAIFQPQVKLDGLLTGELAFVDKGEGVHGLMNITASGLRFLESDFEDHAPVEGSMRFVLEPGRLEVQGDLHGLDPQSSRVSADIPLTLGLRPVSFTFDPQSPLLGYLEAHGHLAPFLQPLMVDSNRIRGQVSAQLALAGDWQHPELRGHIELKDGTYESLFTGTTFKHVEAHIAAKGPSLILETFRAQSGKHGVISGEGILALDPKNDFPFTVDMELRKTNVIQIDHLNAQVAGRLRLEGTLNQATVSGRVKLTDAHIHIPDKLPKDIPTLDVIYVNDGDKQRIDPEDLRERIDPYPLYLDVQIDAPRNLYLNGRGLTTEWGGAVSVKGSTAKPMLFGTANLLRGDFLIAGTLSPLTHGVIHMDGLASRDIQLSLSCDLEVGEVSLPLTLAGPLHALEIEGLSDLSRVDALLLAQAALRLTGGQVAPDILEGLRRRTGLDLLDVGTVGEDDDREFIVQVGKYFSKGVSISVARSMAEKGARTAVDLSLTKNLKLRAEIAEGEEASTEAADVKLLLKWKYDY